MQIKDIYQNLEEFAVVATGLPKEKVIFANSKALVTAKKPYISIAVSSFRNVGTPQKKLGDDGRMNLSASMICVVSIQAFGSLNHEAEEFLNRLHSQLWTELPSMVFKGSMAVQKILKHVSAIPMILNDQTENRAILELEIGYVKTTSYDVGFIENVEMNGLINEQEIQIKREII